MGVVYKARHRALNRLVALKLLRGEILADQEYRERIRAEAKAVASLQHPNIIQVFEVGVTEEPVGDRYISPFIAFEFVDGGSLTQKTNKPQSPRYAAEMVEKLARAVHSAHQQRVIHRDLKPANVLLTRDGEPKIADFGIAKQLGTERDESGRFVTMAGTVMGTPEYMAPEQSAGKPPTPATDIYGLGVILYELLAARVPFQGATPLETMTFSQQQEPISPRRFKPDLSRDLETICLKCLEKSPVTRYASAEALANDLRSFLDGRTIQARRVTEWEKAARWCRRNPPVAASLAGVVLTVLIALALISRSFWLTELAWQSETIQRQEAERREAAERWERYRANITAASSSLELYDAGSARRNLQSSPEFHRNWEWHHLNTRIDQAQIVLTVGETAVEHRRISDDGRRVLFIGADQTARVWRTSDGQLIHALPNIQIQWKSPLEFSPNGDCMAFSTEADEIELRKLEDGSCIRLRGLRKGANMIAFNADGTRLMASAGQTIHVWDVATGETICDFRPFRSDLNHKVISPDGRRAVVSSDGVTATQIWNLDTGEWVADLQGQQKGIEHAVFNRQRTRLLTASAFPDNELKLWDVETGRLIGVMTGHGNCLKHCLFSSDGKRMATCSLDQTVRLWDVDTCQLIAELTGHKGWVNRVAFSPDGTRLVSASQDHTLRLWDGKTGAPLNVLIGHTMEVTDVKYSSDGHRIVSIARDGTARLWDAEKLERNGILHGHTKFVYSVAFHPDGRRVISAAWDGTVRVWDAVTDRELMVLDHGREAIVTSVAIHPGGKQIASRTLDRVTLWDLDSGQAIHRWNSPSDRWRHTRLAFSPNGELLAAGGSENAIYLWDVKTRTEIGQLKGHRDVIRDVAFSPDSRMLVSSGESGDRTIRVWNIAEKKQVQVLEGHTDCVYSLGFSKDGKLLASGSIDGTVRLWDTATWQGCAVLEHGTNVYSVAFTPDGTRLACGCANNAIRLWDVATRQDIVDLRGHGAYVHAIAFSPDGSRLVSGSGDFTLRVWDTNRP